MLNLLPSLATPRRENVDAISNPLNTEVVDPSLAKDRMEMLDLDCRKSNNEICEEIRTCSFSVIDRLEPSLTTVRIDNEDPNAAGDRTLAPLPTVKFPKIEIVLPHRPHDLNEIVLPKDWKSNVDKAEPNLAVDLKLKFEPIST
jgi:hypothetical protein